MSRIDSIGNAVIGPGAVQWMTAGAVFCMRKCPNPCAVSWKANVGQLTRCSQDDSSRYQEFYAEETPELVTPSGARVRVIAGQVEGFVVP